MLVSLHSFIRPSAVVLASSMGLATLAGSASAGVLYLEDFADEAFAANTTIANGAAIGGVGVFDDASRANKAVFNVVQTFSDAPVVTFSFDVVAPVVHTGDPADPEGDGIQTELMFRAGGGTGTSSLGSGDDVVELVLHRDNGNRGGYLNNGNESVFIVANNSAGTLNFASPVDGSNVTLNDDQFAAFIRNNADPNGSFVMARAPGDFLVPTTAGLTPGVMSRFFIGSGSNTDQDTYSIDNVGVVDAVSFETVAIPEPNALALLGVGGLLALRRRRQGAVLIRQMS
jgi:hypothetical protein